MNGVQSPRLSVVVAIVSDTAGSGCDTSHLEESLKAFDRQIDPPPMELIVAYHPGCSGIEQTRTRFPNTRFIRVDDLKTLAIRGHSREHHDELRARGMNAARGEIVALIEDHARPDPHWCARIVEEHQQNVAGVGGAIENGADRPLCWAVYFCDFGKYQNPVPAGETAIASDANVSYKRAPLESIKSVWQDTFNEPSVNWALRSSGQKLALSPSVIVYQHREELRLRGSLQERFTWGRSYAATRVRSAGLGKRMLYAALSPLLPAVLLIRMTVNVIGKGRCVGAFFKALPLTALLVSSWSWGEFVGYVTGRAN